MDRNNNEEKTCPIWIDHKEKVISFKEADGFEIMYFSSTKEIISFTMEQCSHGYRIQ